MADFVCTHGEDSQEFTERAAREKTAPERLHAPQAGFSLDGREEALSVTRHEPITTRQNESGFEWSFLSCGIDSLDLGVGVQWGEDWPKLLSEFDQEKKDAAGTSGRQWRDLDDEICLIHPGAKPPMYRFHLEVPIGHLYLGISESPRRKTPNVYLSLNASALWCLGLHRCIQKFGRVIRELGGRILSIKPSRCDLCADFQIPDGLSLDFLRFHLVSCTRKHRHHENGDRLETFYVGDAGNDVQLRIYDKAQEVLSSGCKNWFQDIWGVEEIRDIWRIEFQIRRKALSQRGIKTLGQLNHSLGGLWDYLSGAWTTLRFPGGSNTTRRPLHPFWADVQACASKFGGIHPFSGQIDALDPADADWYVSHIVGCAIGYGALRGHETWTETKKDLFERLDQRKSDSQYAQALQIKQLKSGRAILPTRGSYPGEWDRP